MAKLLWQNKTAKQVFHINRVVETNSGGEKQPVAYIDHLWEDGGEDNPKRLGSPSHADKIQIIGNDAARIAGDVVRFLNARGQYSNDLHCAIIFTEKFCAAQEKRCIEWELTPNNMRETQAAFAGYNTGIAANTRSAHQAWLQWIAEVEV